MKVSKAWEDEPTSVRVPLVIIIIMFILFSLKWLTFISEKKMEIWEEHGNMGSVVLAAHT